jgi:hypothetical protein
MPLDQNLSYDPVTRQMTATDPLNLNGFIEDLPEPRAPRQRVSRNGQPIKIDDAKLEEFIRAGRKDSWIAKYFGVTQAAVHHRKKKISAMVVREAADIAPQIIAREIRTVDQLCKINQTANALLDGLYENYDEEVEEYNPRTGLKEKAVRKRTRLTDPKVALSTMAEIRAQLKLQMEIFQMLTDTKAVKEFQETVLEILERVEPDLKDAVVKALQRKNALRAALDFK